MPLPDVIVAMPLSTERLRQRGFNQSLEIARLIGARIGVRVDTEACVRVRHSEAQSALNQDKVPRAYQNAVRDYFDDLKK